MFKANLLENNIKLEANQLLGSYLVKLNTLSICFL